MISKENLKLTAKEINFIINSNKEHERLSKLSDQELIIYFAGSPLVLERKRQEEKLGKQIENIK